jgi:hypothetical protein
MNAVDSSGWPRVVETCDLVSVQRKSCFSDHMSPLWRTAQATYGTTLSRNTDNHFFTMRGAVTGFRVSWWKKDFPALQEAYKELKRPKVERAQ